MANDTLRDTQDQSNVLSKKRIIIIFIALALTLFISTLDQTSVSTSLPVIGKDLNAVSTISWVGTSFLIASTAFLLINGRMSDIFGRKTCLITCMGLLALGNLLCGFSKTGIQLFVFRALSGIGAGGINSLVMVIVSDITTLKERGKYQGYLETFIVLGNGFGPLIGGAFSENASWRWTFWFPVILTFFVAAIVMIMLPKSTVEGDWKQKIGHIDYWGIFCSLTAVLFILVWDFQTSTGVATSGTKLTSYQIPISGGGSLYKWNSPIVISFLTIGGVFAILFVMVEWKVARTPVMPIRLFERKAAKILLTHNVIMGIVYWGNIYYLPLYYQNVRGYSPVMSGVMILPLMLAFSIGSMSSGIIISRIGKYNAVLRTGYLLWTAGAGGRISLHRTSHIGVMVVIQIIEGIGIGCCFQPAMIALLANCRKEDRAVAIGLRNFIRTIGGAVGLAAFAAILNNLLLSNIPDTVTPETALQFTTAKNLSESERSAVIDAYMKGVHVVMCLGCPLVGCLFLSSFFIKDVALEGRKKEVVEDTEAGNVNDGVAPVVDAEKS